MKNEELRPGIKSGLTKLASYCSYQERCQKEVLEKLRQLGYDKDDSEEILMYLISEKFLNEERYAKAFARGKFSQNKWGKNKIRQHLQQKDISEYCIRKGLKEIDEKEYLEVLQKLYEKKDTSIKDKNHFVRKTKIRNFLLSKGFEIELINSLL